MTILLGSQWYIRTTFLFRLFVPTNGKSLLVWASAEEEKTDRRILSLQQEKKFAINPLITGQLLPFFPDKCLSHGCAKWAVNTSMQFVEEFFSKMGISAWLDHIKPYLKTEP